MTFTEMKRKLLEKVTEEQWKNFYDWFIYTTDNPYYTEKEIKQIFKDECIVGEYYDPSVDTNVVCLSFESITNEVNNDICMYHGSMVYRIKIKKA